MFAVGMLGSYITQGVYTVAGPFHPFGGAVDIIVVQQDDGTFKSSPWNVKFGKFQGVLKTKEKIVGISVNDVPMDFHMYLDHKGEAYFEKEVEFGEEMLLSPISPTSSGDEMSEFGQRKVLSLQIAKAEDEKMQETTNTGMDTKTSRISNDGDNLNSEMPDHVDSNSTVWISDALVDEDRNEVVIAISESNSYLIEGNLGTINGSQAILRKEEHASERLEKSISKPPSSVYGLVFGGKSQHLLGGSSSTINSRERAEIVVDLLDKRWRTSDKEILFTSTNNSQAVATTTSLGTEVKDTGSLMHDSEGSTSVRNEAPFWKSVSQDTAGAGLIAEDLEQPMSDEANSENARSGEMQTNTLTLEVSAKNRANSVEHVPSEDWFLRSAAEEQTLVLLFQGRLGEAASSNDHNSGDQNGKCNAGQAASDEVAPIGVLVEDVNENPKCGPVPEVVLMSVDGHIITAPVNVEGSHLGQYFDISENSSGGNRDVQVAVSSIAKRELLNPGKQCRSEEFSLIPCSSTISMPAVSVDHGTNELSEMTTEFVSIEEVPALSSEGKIDKCGDTKPVSDFETSEYVRARAQIFSPEMTSDIISSEKIEECTDKEVGSVQNTQLKPERFVVNDMQAADERRRQQAHSSDVTIIPDCTTGESDMILKSEPCLDLGASATPAHYVLDDDSIGTEDLHASRVMEFRNVPPKTCHNCVPLNLHVDGKQSSHIYLPSESGRVSPKVIDSPSQQGCERFYSFKEGSNVDLEAENSEEDLFKSCLALEELPNRAENDHAEALLEVSDSGFEVVHAGNSLLSSDSVDSHICKQPSVKANFKKFMTIRSKPIPVPQGENEKSLDLMSSASLPARFYEAERSNKGHFVGHSVGSGSLPAISQSHLETDATGFQGQDLNFADRRQILESVIYGSKKDSAEIVEVEDGGKSSSVDVDLSLCRHLLLEGMGAEAASVAFESHKVSYEAFQRSGSAIVADDKLVVKIGGRYFTWVEAAPCIVGMVAFGSEFTYKLEGGIAIEAVGSTEDVESQTVDTVPSSTRWNLWPFSFRRSSVEKGSRLASPASKQASSAATNIAIKSPFTKEPSQKNGYYESPQKSKERTYVPTSAQLASLKLKDGPNKVTFTFSTRVLGKTQVDARIYLWKWTNRIVVSDVDGTITKSDVLGQVMPLVGRDWSQSGVTRLFSAIKDNGYELLFLSARAISQAYLTRQFLLNLKQDGETLPDGPVFISPDGLIPSLYREVIRRAPHEFKISCLEGIRELFPRDVNPFYAGFGNRNTDEISYLKVGIPKGKIFIINPKGEVVVNHRVEDVKSYTSLHKLVDDMFPAMSSHEQEDFNSWNYWKLPLPDIEDEFKRMEKKGGD